VTAIGCSLSHMVTNWGLETSQMTCGPITPVSAAIFTRRLLCACVSSLSLVRTLSLHLGPPSSRVTLFQYGGLAQWRGSRMASSQDPKTHLQRPYFQMGSHVQVPGDTAFGKVTIPLSSMGLDLIPIWRPGPADWVTQLVQDLRILHSPCK
jgi:hypothetical protein